MNQVIKVLFITTEWPTKEHPGDVPFLVQYAQALRNQGVEVEVFHFHGRGNPLNYLWAWFEVRKQSFWSQADIIHAHWGQSASVALGSRKPLVITYHGSDLQGIVNHHGKYSLRGQLLVRLNRWIAGKGDTCIAVSDRLVKLLPTCRHSTKVIPMGIDLDLFKPMDKMSCRKALGLDPETRYLLFVSDPARPEKRFSLAQQAVAAANLQNAQLFVVSDQPYETIPLYLNAGDLLLLTSSHEGSPVILKEALACNLPVVAVDVGDAREKLEKIAGCVVCEDDDPETIGRAINQALYYNEPVIGRDSVLDLSWDLIAQHTVAIYQDCLKAKPGTRQ